MSSEPVSEPPYSFSVNLKPSGAPSFEPDFDFYSRDVSYEVRDFSWIAAIPRHNDEEAP